MESLFRNHGEWLSRGFKYGLLVSCPFKSSDDEIDVERIEVDAVTPPRGFSGYSVD